MSYHPVIKEKVYAYITHGRRLLVFRHTAYPEAGIQVPGGSVEPNESFESAVLREVKEETGLTNLSIPHYLGEHRYSFTSVGIMETHHRTFFHLTPNDIPPETWRHMEGHPSNGHGEEIEFEFYWVNFATMSPGLIAEMDAMLPVLEKRLRYLS